MPVRTLAGMETRSAASLWVNGPLQCFTGFEDGLGRFFKRQPGPDTHILILAAFFTYLPPFL
jgi:hypothetical protein